MTSPLDYAPPQKNSKRRLIRRIVLLFLLASLAFTLWHYWPAISRQSRLLYIQRQCMNHTDAPLDSFSSTLPPPEFRDLCDFVSDPRLPQLIAYGPVSPSSAVYHDSHAYLHARQSPAGRRLVIATFTVMQPFKPYPTYSAQTQRVLNICIIEPATFFSPPKVLARAYFFFSDSGNREFTIFRFDTDPADDSLFTLTIISNDFPPSTATTTHTVPFHINAANDPVAGRNSLGL